MGDTESNPERTPQPDQSAEVYTQFILAPFQQGMLTPIERVIRKSGEAQETQDYFMKGYRQLYEIIQIVRKSPGKLSYTFNDISDDPSIIITPQEAEPQAFLLHDIPLELRVIYKSSKNYPRQYITLRLSPRSSSQQQENFTDLSVTLAADDDANPLYIAIAYLSSKDENNRLTFGLESYKENVKSIFRRSMRAAERIRTFLSREDQDTCNPDYSVTLPIFTKTETLTDSDQEFLSAIVAQFRAAMESIDNAMAIHNPAKRGRRIGMVNFETPLSEIASQFLQWKLFLKEITAFQEISFYKGMPYEKGIGILIAGVNHKETPETSAIYIWSNNNTICCSYIPLLECRKETAIIPAGWYLSYAFNQALHPIMPGLRQVPFKGNIFDIGVLFYGEKGLSQQKGTDATRYTFTQFKGFIDAVMRKQVKIPDSPVENKGEVPTEEPESVPAGPNTVRTYTAKEKVKDFTELLKCFHDGDLSVTSINFRIETASRKEDPVQGQEITRVKEYIITYTNETNPDKTMTLICAIKIKGSLTGINREHIERAVGRKSKRVSSNVLVTWEVQKGGRAEADKTVSDIDQESQLQYLSVLEYIIKE